MKPRARAGKLSTTAEPNGGAALADAAAPCGEGDSGNPPGQFPPPTARQRQRLGEMVAWSGENGCHPVTMTYTFTWHDRLHVDLYHVQQPGIGATQTQSALPMTPREIPRVDRDFHYS